MNKSYNYIDNEVLLVTDTFNFLHRNYNLKLGLFFITKEGWAHFWATYA